MERGRWPRGKDSSAASNLHFETGSGAGISKTENNTKNNLEPKSKHRQLTVSTGVVPFPEAGHRGGLSTGNWGPKSLDPSKACSRSSWPPKLTRVLNPNLLARWYRSETPQSSRTCTHFTRSRVRAKDKHDFFKRLRGRCVAVWCG